MPAKAEPRSLKPAQEGSFRPREPPSRNRQPSGRISAACEACKKRKTKCSGHPPPCQMCKQLDTACVIDLTLDMRRRTALQRTVEESRAFQDTLIGVVGILRSGDESEIQDLVSLVQQTMDTEDLVETLQAKLQQSMGSQSIGLHGQTKEERDEALSFGSEKEGAGPPRSLFTATPGLPRKRPLFMQDDHHSRPSIDPIQSRSSGIADADYLASRYLPLISKLKTVSDWEATRILHDLRTSPVSTEGVATLNLLDRHQSRPHLNLSTSQYLERMPGSQLVDRTNWHPSLQPTTPELQTPVASSSFQEKWIDQSRGKNKSWPSDRSQSGDASVGVSRVVSTSGSGTKRSSESSTSEPYSPSMKMSNASQDIQKHPVTYEAMQITQNHQILELFGDLRTLGGHAFHSSLDDFAARSSATVPLYLIQSRFVPEDSLLSKVFTGFRDAARQMVATGTPALDIVNGSDVVVDLFFRERCPTDCFTCASWACELCRTFSEVDDLVRLGCVFLLARMMRWMICPTQEAYLEIPACQRPTPTQCFVPHMPAIDLHPMPAFRDMLCNRLQDWMSPIVRTGISCNWPLTMDEALETNVNTGSVKVSKLFAEHVSKSENWSLNSYALSLYPELEGKIRIEDG